MATVVSVGIHFKRGPAAVDNYLNYTVLESDYFKNFKRQNEFKEGCAKHSISLFDLELSMLEKRTEKNYRPDGS